MSHFQAEREGASKRKHGRYFSKLSKDTPRSLWRWGVRKRRIILITFCAFIGAIILFGGGLLTGWYLSRPFAPLFETYGLINQFFVFELPSKERLLQGAISGMLEELDEEYTYYLNPQRAGIMMDFLGGSFGGIGIGHTVENGQKVITYVMPDTPAEKAGLKAGDTITHVDGEPVEGLPTDLFVAMVRGKPGTKVTLTVYRTGEGRLEITAIREVIDIEELRTKLLADGRIGYIWFAAFSDDSTPQVEKALHQLLEVDKVEGLILDIRGNRGGDLRAAVSILSQFLPEGKTAFLLGTPGPFSCPGCPNTTHSGGMALEIPLVVLIDGGTGSAAELFVAAIKDHERAVLIGTTTIGKGVGGVPFPLSNGGRVFVTTFEFLSPKGRTIHKVGVQPDEGFFIPTTPAQRMRGRDAALEKAIEVLLEQLGR